MTEENKNSETPDTASTADQNHKLSKDAHGLGPLQGGQIRLGAVDMIVGEGGVEVPGFVATRNEVFQLARYWATEILRLDFDYFIYRSLGSSEWRTREFAARRLNTVSQFIGEGDARKASKEAEQAFKERVDPLSWKNFTGGGNSPGAAYSRESLQRAYDLYEAGYTHFAVMEETGLDKETAEWISNRQLAGLGLPPDQPTTLSDAENYEL
jgi:hypothetical protein